MIDALQQLRPHLNTGKKIRIELNLPSQPKLNGYLMELSNELGLMHCFDDFEPDGYSVFRLSNVVSLRSGDYEHHWDRMLGEEGLLAGLEKTINVELESLFTAIRSIDHQYQMMSIECENEKDGTKDFYIGQLVSINKSEMTFDHFDALGQWEESCAMILLEEVTLIQFETPYITIFRKYLSGSPSITRRGNDE